MVVDEYMRSKMYQTKQEDEPNSGSEAKMNVAERQGYTQRWELELYQQVGDV